jgi:hypothetical protein
MPTGRRAGRRSRSSGTVISGSEISTAGASGGLSATPHSRLVAGREEAGIRPRKRHLAGRNLDGGLRTGSSATEEVPGGHRTAGGSPLTARLVRRAVRTSTSRAVGTGQRRLAEGENPAWSPQAGNSHSAPSEVSVASVLTEPTDVWCSPGKTTSAAPTSTSTGRASSSADLWAPGLEEPEWRRRLCLRGEVRSKPDRAGQRAGPRNSWFRSVAIFS